MYAQSAYESSIADSTLYAPSITSRLSQAYTISAADPDRVGRQSTELVADESTAETESSERPGPFEIERPRTPAQGSRGLPWYVFLRLTLIHRTS